MKRGAEAPPELFAFRLRLCRLGDCNCLACIPYLEARKAADSDILAQLADLRGNQLRDGYALVLDEGLIEQADLFVELLHLASDHLLRNVGGLAALNGLVEVDFFLSIEVCLRYVLFANVLRIARRNVHGDVMDQLLEVVGAGDKVALAVDFYQHADLA